MREKDVEAIIRQLTSFYREYLPIDSAFEELLRTFIKTFEFMWDEADYYYKHISVENAPTLKKIPYALLDISSAVYTKDIAHKLEELPFGEVILYLNKHQYFSALTFSERKTREPIVYNMRLKKDYFKQDELRLFEDYFLRDNKLYLLPKYILDTTTHLYELHATDIRTDTFLMEQKWGQIFDVETGNFLTRHQYRDVLSAFRRMLLSDLTIRDMIDSVKMATKWDMFNIQDIKTPDLPEQRKRLYEEWLVSPAKFLVLVGEAMIKDKMLLNILITLMDEGKEAQTHYLIMFLIYRLDILDFSNFDEVVVNYLFFHGEISVKEDHLKVTNKITATDLFYLPHRYDVGRHYDWMLTYDYPGRLNTPLLMDMDEAIMDKGIYMDAPWFYNSDYFEIKLVEFPKIPRELKVSKNGNNVSFTFKENKDGTRHYELYGKVNKEDEFELLKKVESTKNTIITINYDATSTGMRYYKIRATCNKKRSLFTLITDSKTIN